jgi:outer membrane protein assembly factor BamB
MFVRLFMPCTFAALFLSQAAVLASDWPQWRGPSQDGHVPPGDAVPTTLPAEPKKLWSLKAGEGFSSPVVAGRRVFYMDNVEGKETLHAVDATGGKPLWSEVIDDTFTDKQGPPGPRSTPTVDGDRVYAQSCQGELQCRNVADGRLVWRKHFTRDFGAVFIGETGTAVGATRHGNTAPPVVDGDRLIALAGGTNGASVVCLDKRTGNTLWKSQNDEAGYAPAVIATLAGKRQYVVFTAEGVIGLEDTSGRLLWRFPIKTRFARHVTTPVIVGDLVVVSSHEHGLFGLRVAREGGGLGVSQAWLLKEAAMNFSSPVAVDGHVYGLGPQRNIVCVDAGAGKLAWSQDGYITSAANKAHASFLVLGKNLLMTTDSGELALFAADAQEFRGLARLQVSGSTWSSPAYADGKLFVKDGITRGGQLQCLELKQP